VIVPNTTASPTTEAWIQGGKYGLLIAGDTADISKHGHITTYSADTGTVEVQIPFKAGEVPKRTVLYPGSCRWIEMIGM